APAPPLPRPAPRLPDSAPLAAPAPRLSGPAPLCGPAPAPRSRPSPRFGLAIASMIPLPSARATSSDAFSASAPDPSIREDPIVFPSGAAWTGRADAAATATSETATSRIRAFMTPADNENGIHSQTKPDTRPKHRVTDRPVASPRTALDVFGLTLILIINKLVTSTHHAGLRLSPF